MKEPKEIKVKKTTKATKSVKTAKATKIAKATEIDTSSSKKLNFDYLIAGVSIGFSILLLFILTNVNFYQIFQPEIPSTIEFSKGKLGDVFLGSMKPTYEKTASGVVLVNKLLEKQRKAKFPDGTPVDKFITTQAPAFVSYKIPLGAKRFTAVGIKPFEGIPAITGTYSFVVIIDGEKKLESSSVKKKGMVPMNIEIPEGSKNLLLYVSAEGSIGGVDTDQAIWAYPYFRMK